MSPSTLHRILNLSQDKQKGHPRMWCAPERDEWLLGWDSNHACGPTGYNHAGGIIPALSGISASPRLLTLILQKSTNSSFFNLSFQPDGFGSVRTFDLM